MSEKIEATLADITRATKKLIAKGFPASMILKFIIANTYGHRLDSGYRAHHVIIERFLAENGPLNQANDEQEEGKLKWKLHESGIIFYE